VLSTWPVGRAQLQPLKARDIKAYLSANGVSTHGCVGKLTTHIFCIPNTTNINYCMTNELVEGEKLLQAIVYHLETTNTKIVKLSHNVLDFLGNNLINLTKKF
jgi:hypothetical protein